MKHLHSLGFYTSTSTLKTYFIINSASKQPTIIDFGKARYENDVKAYFIGGTAKESTYNMKHRHLASELRRISGTKPSKITDTQGIV